MNVTLNSKPVCIEQGESLLSLLQEQGLIRAAGMAVALNSRVVPRQNWEETRLADGDDILVINAAYGG